MITMTITNVSASEEIGLDTDFPLPFPYDFFTIAASGTKALAMRVQDLAMPEGGVAFTGFTVGDALQKLVQQSVITVAFANLAATLATDVAGDAVTAES